MKIHRYIDSNNEQEEKMTVNKNGENREHEKYEEVLMLNDIHKTKCAE